MNSLGIKSRIYITFTLLGVIMVAEALYAVNTIGDGNDTAKIILTVVPIALAILLIIEEAIWIKVFVKPVKEIETKINHISTGDIDAKVKVFRDDELGDVAKNLNSMIESNRLQTEIAQKIAKGDMTVDVKVRSDKDVLAMAYLELVNKNNDILSNIKESTMQVTVGAEQVADASQALAQGSTEQASAIEQVTASMCDIAEKTKVNAEQATVAEKIVHEMKEGASKGNTQMNEMMGAMNEINESSENISKVIKVIDDIAFQTNILALNATVEAARAGVHGKGFAVVAEEVRNLAEKSAAAAKETSDMIQDSIHRVKHGSTLAQDTSHALNSMVDSIVKVVELIDTIATASNEQATAVTQINQAINQVSEVIQNNSATSQECAAASEELANQAEQLRNLVGLYKLKDNGFRGDSLSQISTKTNKHLNRRDNNESIISLDNDFGKY